MTTPRRFLFLQGPHGPFFARLAKALHKAGCDVWRVGFNAGDRAFWHDRHRYIPYRDPPEAWPEQLRALLTQHHITDLVLYGDARPIHAQAIACAQEMGLRIHVFEEGYLRPYWVTYERDGANGHSRLMSVDLTHMTQTGALAQDPPPPATWGDMREHIFYGALYHWCVLFLNRSYRNFRPHRPLPLWHETLSYSRRLLTLPVRMLTRAWTTRRMLNMGAPYHLALMQLDHDANFRAHGPFEDQRGFITTVIEAFATGAPDHHHLVFKAHPLESGRLPLRQIIATTAQAQNVTQRVHYIPGGKLAHILDAARSAITVNSTAAQQVLWRGIPLKVFGKAIYAKPEFVSDQAPAAFFAAPAPTDRTAYLTFRRFLLETSQLPGGFYSRRGRTQLLREVVDRILADQDPYDAALAERTHDM